MNDVQIYKRKRGSEIFGKIWKALHNQTFLYILKRVLRSLLTAILIIAVVTALIRLIPDEKLYDISTYNKLLNKSRTAAENLRKFQLASVGRYDRNGNKVSLIGNIFQYIYWVLPIYKEVPYRWNDKGEVLKYWTGFSYFGRVCSSIICRKSWNFFKNDSLDIILYILNRLSTRYSYGKKTWRSN